MSEAVKNSKSFYIQWGIAILLPASAFLAAYSSGVGILEATFYAITLFALSLWAMGLMSDPLVGIALPIAYVVAGIGTPRQILSGWTTDIGWVVLGGIIITSVLVHTGLAKRIAFGGSLSNQKIF